MMTSDAERHTKASPEFFMPEGAEDRLPPNWIVENNDGNMDITVPSWGTGPKKFYRVRMTKVDRRLYCECPGFQYHGKCHHLPYLIGMVNKPLHPRGVQDTSLEAFFDIQDKLGQCRRVVYDCLRHIGPASNRQLSVALGWEINRITPRINELRKTEPPMVEDAGKQLDPITGKWVHRWRVTGVVL